ncbi:hypothetical protein AgCh_013729 [Apium graveolens]
MVPLGNGIGLKFLFRKELIVLLSYHNRYSIEEILPVMQPQEGGVRGQRSPGVCLDGRPPPVVNECSHWGCGVNSGVYFGSSVSVVNRCPRWETSKYPALCTQKLGITCPAIW